MRRGFIFYSSFYEAIKELNDVDQLALYKSINYYIFEGTEPTLSGIAKTVWTLIKPQLDANIKRYENGIKGGKFGKLGGRPKKPLENPDGVSEETQEKPEAEVPKKSIKDDLVPVRNDNGTIVAWEKQEGKK